METKESSSAICESSSEQATGTTYLGVFDSLADFMCCCQKRSENKKEVQHAISSDSFV